MRMGHRTLAELLISERYDDSSGSINSQAEYSSIRFHSNQFLISKGFVGKFRNTRHPLAPPPPLRPAPPRPAPFDEEVIRINFVLFMFTRCKLFKLSNQSTKSLNWVHVKKIAKPE